MKNFFITTPIYYVNDIPHIGHAYTTIACDVIARYKRMSGYNVKFLTGTDEHGQKIQEKALSKNITPQELVDDIHLNFKRLWKILNISNDDFIRTTEQRHVKAVQAVFKKLLDQGDIYKGTYSGYYCVPCETYVPENSMGENKTCPQCGRPLKIMEEESYFFKGSKYIPDLIKFYEQNAKAILPEIRYNEIMSFLRGGVHDQSVSRTSLKWGIPVPGDEKHVIYVWFDALVNYMAALGYPDENSDDFKNFWPCVRHMVGKDIIRFHCVTWPLMLLALGINLPAEIIAHGWWTYEGEKMSKTKGNVIDPFKMVEEYGLDQFRYFLMREIPFGNDGNFSESALVGRINSDLANDLGNLLNRTLQMINNYCGAKVPECDNAESDLSTMSEKILTRVDEAMNKYAFDEALKIIWEFISRANKFIDETTPWKLAKENSDESKAKLNYVLLNLYEALRLSGLLIAPFMPRTSQRIYSQLGIEQDPVTMLYKNFKWGNSAGNVIKKSEVLFPRIDLDEWQKAQDAKKAPQNQTQEQEPEHEAEISIDDFRKIELRVGKIISAEEIKKSKKLYKLEIDLGYEKRTVCSGIKNFFKTDELIGKNIILVTNLKPAKLCGIESNGMILAASKKIDGNAEALTLVIPENLDGIPLGSRVS